MTGNDVTYTYGTARRMVGSICSIVAIIIVVYGAL